MLSKHLIKGDKQRSQKPLDIFDAPKVKRWVTGTPRPRIEEILFEGQKGDA